MRKRKWYRKLLRHGALIVAFSLCFVLCLGTAGLWGKEKLLLASILAESDGVVKQSDEKPTVILDAGHGGGDPGAVCGDLLEKDLNLAVTLRLKPLLEAAGCRVLLTRERDEMLMGEKQKDLQARLSLTRANPDAILVSIHMNRFSLPDCKGVTVYYSPNREESLTLAKTVQTSVKSFLQPDNHRVLKKADSAIYLLHRTGIPAVLIECGFLSNAEDAAMLRDPDGSASLCATLASAIVGYLFDPK